MNSIETTARNSRARMLVGLAVVGILGFWCRYGLLPTPVAVRSTSIAAAQPAGFSPRLLKLMELARSDHIALLQWAMQHYKQTIHDYRCTLRKQERINGRLMPEQVIDVLFKERPFSLLMRWRDGAATRIDKLLYVERLGDGSDQMIVHPTGLFAWIKSVRKDVNCEEIRRSSLRRPDQFGFYRSMQSLLEVYRRAATNGDLQFAALADGKVLTVHGRQTVGLVRMLPPGKGYPAAKAEIYMDVEYLVPVMVVLYDWQDRLIGSWSYTDIRLNVGLDDARFTAKANGL